MSLIRAILTVFSMLAVIAAIAACLYVAMGFAYSAVAAAKERKTTAAVLGAVLYLCCLALAVALALVLSWAPGWWS